MSAPAAQARRAGEVRYALGGTYMDGYRVLSRRVTLTDAYDTHDRRGIGGCHLQDTHTGQWLPLAPDRRATTAG